MKISDIKVGPRVRQGVGDPDKFAKLVESMRRRGLLQPIVVTPDGWLIAGFRRLHSPKRLGWTEIAVHVVDNLTDALARVRAERDENLYREPLTPSEAVALGKPGRDNQLSVMMTATPALPPTALAVVSDTKL
jgi:ParB family chromosome partitioning protein